MTVRAPYVYLGTLAPGTRFKTASGRVGTLLYASELRARVKWDASAVRKVLRDRETDTVIAEFDAPGRAEDIAPRTEVIAI